jgi:hypothetical protein
VRLATDSSTQLNDFPHAALFSGGGGSGAARQQVERSPKVGKTVDRKTARWHSKRKSAYTAPTKVSERDKRRSKSAQPTKTNRALHYIRRNAQSVGSRASISRDPRVLRSHKQGQPASQQLSIHGKNITFPSPIPCVYERVTRHIVSSESVLHFAALENSKPRGRGHDNLSIKLEQRC